MLANFNKIAVLVCLPFWIFIQEGLHYNNTIGKTIKHAVEVHHPGKGDSYIESQTLFEIRNKKGVAIEFYMNVESVICVENVCKVVPVRIFWNYLGEYIRYELDEGVTLEKYEADLFEKEDYKKIHKILSDPDSPFKNVNVDEVLTVVDETHNDTDAVSGATALDLNEEDTVPGAALTCFTLWHWTYGDIQQIIRNYTGKSYKNKNFKHFLTSKNTANKLLAVEQLIETGNFKKDLIKEVIEQAVNYEVLAIVTIDYLEKTSSKKYFKGIEQLFLKGDAELKVLTINSLLQTNFDFPNGYLNDLSNHILDLKSYPEISLFLRLMKKENKSGVIVKNVIKLLDKDILIARSAYWFLKNKNLTTKQIERMAAFYEEHKDQL